MHPFKVNKLETIGGIEVIGDRHTLADHISDPRIEILSIYRQKYLSKLLLI